MTGISNDAGHRVKAWTKAGLSLLGAAALAVPLAAAWATSQDSNQPATTTDADPVEAASAEPAAPAATDGAATGATTAELTTEQLAHARETFNNFSCSACHTLGDARASGQIGPSLDGNAALDHDFIVNRVTHGQGAMPGFGGQIPDEDIAELASYVMQVKK